MDVDDSESPSTLIQWGVPKIAKSVYNFDDYGLWHLCYTGLYLLGFIDQLITRGSHIVSHRIFNYPIQCFASGEEGAKV